MSNESEQMIGAPEFLAIPRFVVSSFHTMGTPTELHVVGSTPHSAMSPTGELGLALAPQVHITLGPLAAKELAILLGQYVSRYESDNGPLISEFIKKSSAL